MFTGIIEELGTIQSIHKVSEQAVQLTVEANQIMEDIHLGDSIAVNGICLTVTHFSTAQFQVDVMPETIKSTSLQSLQEGSNVNLERSMPANGRFGGHFVTGHIDGTGEILSQQQKENAVYYQISISNELSRYIIEKGSIAVDGVSLTIFDDSDRSFTISLIPYTLSETILGEKAPGDTVNLECDMLAKYIGKMIGQQGMTEKYLNE